MALQQLMKYINLINHVEDRWWMVIKIRKNKVHFHLETQRRRQVVGLVSSYRMKFETKMKIQRRELKNNLKRF